MGCVQSSGDIENATAAAPSASAPKQHQRREASAAVDQAPPKKKPPAAPKSNDYETNAMATYSTGGGAGDLFGLFAKDAKDEMATKAELDRAGLSRVDLAVCPEDDGCSEAQHSGLLLLQGVAMTVPYTILVAGAGDADRLKLQKIVDDVFAVVDQHFNNWKEDSEISKISKLAGGKSSPVSREMQTLFAVVDQVFAQTNGLFDPTIASVLATTRTYLIKHGKPTTQRDVDHLKHAVGWDSKLKFSAKRDKVTVQNSNTGIELGGIAKGHAVDMLINSLNKAGFPNLYVDWGADISARGRHPDGRPWRTALVDVPELSRLFGLWKADRLKEAIDPNHALYLADLEDIAVATSGDYFQIEKFGFHHIVDPKNLQLMRASQSSVGSISVFAKTCAVSDAIATAAMTMPSAKAAASWLEELQLQKRITGFCVIGRDGVQIHKTTSPLVSLQSSNNVSEESTSSLEANAADLAPWLSVLPRVDAVVSIEDGAGVHVESIATLSIEAVMISFYVRRGVKKGQRLAVAYLNGDDLDLRQKIGKKSQMFHLDKAFLSSRTHFDAVVENAVLHDSGSIVWASIRKIQTVQSSQLVTTGRHSVSLPQAPIPGGLSTENRLKAVMRRNPSPVAVITFMETDGSTYGMTATSVRIASVERSLVTFNAQKDGLFYLAMQGSKSGVLNFPIEESSGSALANRFTSNISFSEKEKDSLLTDQKSLVPILRNCMALEYTIESELDCTDHVLLCCVVTKVIPALGKHKSLLVRKDGDYQLL